MAKKIFKLAYIPPYDFRGLLKFYVLHKVGNLERFEEDKMIRFFNLDGHFGQVEISDDPANSQLLVVIEFPDESRMPEIKSKIRSLFDLDTDPLEIAKVLSRDPKVKKIHKRHPGIRLPSGWDPFEVAISTILGQLVSMQRARSLVSDIINLLGSDTGISINGEKIKLFPTAYQIATGDLSTLKTTNARKQTLIEFSKAMLEDRVSLDASQSLEEFSKSFTAIKGIGKWTADYVALKALRIVDAFPSTDLVLARALVHHPEQILEKMSPMRGYVAALFWCEYSTAIKNST